MSIKLGEMCNFQSGGTPSKNNSEFFDGTIPWVTTTALNGSKIDERNAATWITEKAIKESAAKIVPANSIMVGTRVGVGKVAVNTVEMSTSQDIISLIDINEERWDKDYLCKFLQSKSDYLNSQARGATIKGIKINVLAELAVPDISVKEQCRISEVLNTVTKLVNARQQQLAKLNELVKARFVEMFIGSDESNGWSQCTISDVSADMRTGPFGSALHHDEFVDKGVFVLGIDNAVENKFSYNKMRYITEEKYYQLKRYTVFPGDVIITIMGTVGRSAVIPDDMPKAINTKHLACITVDKEKINPYFLSSAFQIHPDIRSQLQKECKGAIMNGLNLTIIKGLSFKCPPLALQEMFVAFYKQIDKVKLSVQNSIEQMEILKKTLMQQYFG